MSDTPRTDKETGKSIGSDSIVYASFARQLERELAEMTAYADKLAAGFPEGMLPKDIEVLREANAKLAEEVCEYRGLLIELYNDLNIIHSGNAVRKLSKMFREENYNS
jgi:hypothetical protein